MWDDDYSSFRLVWKFFAFIWNINMMILSAIFVRIFRGRINAQNRRARRVVDYRKPVSVTQLLESVSPDSRVVISGGGNDPDIMHWRDSVAARTLALSTQSNRGAVVLHRGNSDLVGRIQSLVDPSRLVIVDSGNLRYDPLCDYNTDDCKEILVAGIEANGVEFENGQAYLEGLILSVRYCLKKQPTLELLVRLTRNSLDSLQNQLQKFREMGKITPAQQEEATGLLIEGASGLNIVRNHLRRLQAQLATVAVNDKNVAGSDMINIRRALQNGKILIMDLSSVNKPKQTLGPLVEELNRSALLYGGFLLVDDLPVVDSPEMTRLLENGVSNLGHCLSTKNLFALCDNSQEKMDGILNGSACRLCFTHQDGSAAEAWEKSFGTYEKLEITDGAMVPGFKPTGMAKHWAVAKKWEHRVPVEQIQGLPVGCVFARQSEDKEIMHCVLKDE